VHDHKGFVRRLRRQYCGRFIQYQDIGIPVERLYDFNPLLGADGQVADNSVRVYFNIVLAAEIADPPRDGAPVQDCQFSKSPRTRSGRLLPNMMFSVTVSGGTSMKCW
jgi:hypothetical protein